MFRLFAALVMLLPTAAFADERHVDLGSFDKLRVNGVFDVTVTTGGSPGATIIADRAVIGDIDLHGEGTTLTVRRNVNGRWTERGQATATTPARIVLSTPNLTSLAVVGGSRVAVSRLIGPRINLAATGNGAIVADAVEGDQLNVQLIGEGTITVAGRVRAARLVANGSGAINAPALDAGDLTAHLDGLGTIAARARYTAQVSSTGLGTITVAGRPKCRVTASAGAPVSCGTIQ